MHELGTATAITPTAPNPLSRWLGRDIWWYAGAVAVGAGLIVAAAVNQAYNQNELKQIAPYGSNDLFTITHGTRQPPLDALLGSLFQHLLGEGQLRQRLVPVLAGIGTLILLGLLLRRLGLGHAGALALWLVSTQPLLVRYSAYTRPYALTVFLCVMFVFAAHGWMESRRAPWLVAAVVAACALPLTRVPEPNTFLVASAAALAWFSLRGRRTWTQTWPLIMVALAGVAFLGYPQYRSLAADSGSDFDPSPAGIVDRFGSGAREVTTHLLPWMGDWFPWWPVTVVLLVAALALPTARRRLLGQWGWAWWPLLIAPLVFALAYHFMSPVSFELRPYRDRYAYFYLPAFALLVAALAGVMRDLEQTSRNTRVGVGLLLGAALLAQLPATADVVTRSVSPDFVQAGELMADDLPADAIVVYATPVVPGVWRQKFMDTQLDPETTPLVIDATEAVAHSQQVPATGPVYVLVLDGECASSAYCDEPSPPWDHDVPNWGIAARFDRFTLYEPTAGHTGRDGVVDALVDFAAAFGPEPGLIETFAAAAILNAQGHARSGRALIGQAFAEIDPQTARSYRRIAGRSGLNPFG